MIYKKTTISGTWYTGEPSEPMWVLAYFNNFALVVYFNNDHKWLIPEPASVIKKETIKGMKLEITPTYWIPFPDFNAPNSSTETVQKQNLKMKFIGS